jgi:hypothetical protein
MVLNRTCGNSSLRDKFNFIGGYMEEDKQTCALCKKVVIPTFDNENHCSVEITHHYGSPKDGDVLLYDVCIECVENIFKNAIPLSKKSMWDDCETDLEEKQNTKGE